MNEHNATEWAYKNGYENGRIDGIKEFAERLKHEIRDTFFAYAAEEQCEYLDSLLQEMVGEK